MRISQTAVGSSGKKKEESLIGSRIESFQLPLVQFSSDVPHAKVGDSIRSVSTLQQPCLTQYLGPAAGMVFTDRDVSARRPWSTLKLSVTMASVKPEERPISRMEPRGSWEHSRGQFVTECPNSYAGPPESEISQYEIDIGDSFIRAGAEYTLNALIFIERDHPDQKSTRTSGQSASTVKCV